MNPLIAVHAPAAMLGNLLVISVELWDQAIYVDLARLDDEKIKRSWDEYAAAAEAAHSGGFPAAVWRAEWQFEPGVPAGASRLTIASDDDALELTL